MIYKGRFNQIPQGEISCENLRILADNLIKKDCVNFDIDNVGLGFTSNLSLELLKYIPEDKNTKILIINGITLELYNILKENGYNNVTLAFGNWNKEKQNYIDTSKETFEIIKEYVENNFDDKITIIRLEEIMGKKFDLIIANPPYAIGNEITQSIIDNVDYNQFINLMPLSKYKKNKLYQNVLKSYLVVNKWEENTFDAATAPIISLLSKEQKNYESYLDFEINNTYDKRLSKFWEEQTKREKTYLEHICILGKKDFNRISSKTSFSCGIYTPNVIASNGPKSITNPDGSFKENDRHYIWNFLKPEGTINQYFDTTNNGTCINQTVTSFKTEQEADNFKAWAHSGELKRRGRLQGLFSILLRGLNKPTGCPFDYAIPRVDWSHPWTDEEILRDYGYTEEEIKEILSFNDDLNGLKKESFDVN